MQIASANSAAPRATAMSKSDSARASTDTGDAAAVDKPVDKTADKATDKATDKAPTSSKLTLSASAKEAHAAEKHGHAASAAKADGAKDHQQAEAAKSTASTGDAQKSDDASTVDGAKKEGDSGAASDDKASTLKSFAYGSLGLQSPDEAAKNGDGAYSAGKWLAAAITVGGIISLLI